MDPRRSYLVKVSLITVKVVAAAMEGIMVTAAMASEATTDPHLMVLRYMAMAVTAAKNPTTTGGTRVSLLELILS